MEIIARAVGRRKEAVAQVQIVKGTGKFLINNKSAEDYLQHNMSSLISVKAPFEILKNNVKHTSETEEQTTNSVEQFETIHALLTHLQYDTLVKVKGGGLIGQSDAIKLGIARALCELANSSNFQNFTTSQSTETTNNENGVQTENQQIGVIRKQLKAKGYLTQDSRVIERKKYGLRKARKAPQYHKR